MVPEIRSYAPDIAAALLALKSGREPLVLSFTALPKVPEHLRADELAIVVGQHEYDLGDSTHEVPSVDIFGAPDSLRALGLVIASCALRHEPKEVCIDLPTLDPRTVEPLQRGWPGAVQLSYIRIAGAGDEHIQTEAGSLRSRPVTIEYRPKRIGRHPLANVASRKCPYATLTSTANSRDGGGRVDTLCGFGLPNGMLSLATALFDVTHPSCTQIEVDFESDIGFGGVAQGSIEMRLQLPGSIRWQAWFDDRVR